MPMPRVSVELSCILILLHQELKYSNSIFGAASSSFRVKMEEAPLVQSTSPQPLYRSASSLSAIRNLRLKTLLSPVSVRTDFQPILAVHASSTDIYIHYTSYMPEVPVSTCVCFPVPMRLTVQYIRLSTILLLVTAVLPA